jgi:acyl-CoA dehydrogenase
MLERVAKSRIQIDTARLSVLNAAIKIDETDAKGALKEIAEVKVQIPNMLLEIIDRAMQAYGGAGVSQDTPLANMYALGRTMRIVDGPDEVHMQQLGRNESKRGQVLAKRMDAQSKKADVLLRQHGMQKRDVLELNRVSGGDKSRL